MVGENYPSNWPEIRKKVLAIYEHECANCQRSDAPLEVHHAVPVGCGGSHRIRNLVALCKQCHRAAHGEAMAPRVRWYTNGQLNNDEFGEHLHLWKSLRARFGSPRFDSDEECVYVPVGDADRISSQIGAS